SGRPAEGTAAAAQDGIGPAFADAFPRRIQLQAVAVIVGRILCVGVLVIEGRVRCVLTSHVPGIGAVPVGAKLAVRDPPPNRIALEREEYLVFLSLGQVDRAAVPRLHPAMLPAGDLIFRKARAIEWHLTGEVAGGAEADVQISSWNGS